MKITTIENDRIQRSVFFRLPIQNQYFDEYSGEAYSFIKKCKKNIFVRLLNKTMFNACIKERWFDDIDFAGFIGKVFVSPIYFSRSIREATHYITNHPEISKIHAIGEETYKNPCAGAVIYEKATIFFHSRKKQIIKTNETLSFYYNHKIKELLKEK